MDNRRPGMAELKVLRAGCGACNSPQRLPGLGAITGRLEQPPSDLMRLQHRQKDNTPVGWEDGCVRNQTRRIMAPGLGPSRLSRPWCPWLILQSTANSACSISKSCLSFAQASPSRRQTNASPWSIGGFCQLQGLSCHCDSVIASPLRAGQSKKRGAHCPEPPRFFSPEAPFRLRRDHAQVHWLPQRAAQSGTAFATWPAQPPRIRASDADSDRTPSQAQSRIPPPAAVTSSRSEALQGFQVDRTRHCAPEHELRPVGHWALQQQPDTWFQAPLFR